MPGLSEVRKVVAALDALQQEGMATGLWKVKKFPSGTFGLIVEIKPNDRPHLDSFINSYYCTAGFTRYDLRVDKGTTTIEISDPEVLTALAENKLYLLPKFKKSPVAADSSTKKASKLLSSHKSTDEFVEVKKLSDAEASGKKSHDVAITKKKPPKANLITSKQAAGKYKHQWYAKNQPIALTANTEVIAQELFRMNIPNHPKTRLVIGDRNETIVSSREVPGFKSLEKMDARELRKKLGSGEYKGLGEVMVMALWLNECDLKLGNMGVDKNGKVVKIDGDWCFAQLRGQSEITITEDTLAKLPLADIAAYNWLDYKVDGKLNLTPVVASVNLQHNSQFRNEIHETILKILLLPHDSLTEFVRHYMGSNEDAEKIFTLLAERRQALLAAALINDNFCSFMKSSQADKLKTAYIKQLNDFKLTGKTQLSDHDRVKDINERFDSIRATAAYVPTTTKPSKK